MTQDQLESDMHILTNRWWTPEQVRRLWAMWGVYCSQDIAREIGKSSASVIGKANRMGLPPIDPIVRAQFLRASYQRYLKGCNDNAATL